MSRIESRSSSRTYDALLTPALGGPPVLLGEIDQESDWNDLIEQLFTYVRVHADRQLCRATRNVGADVLDTGRAADRCSLHGSFW